MKRDLINDLLLWKQSEGRKPLILRGARQVGKTYLLKQFGQQSYQNTLYLNFEEDKRLHQLFEASLNASQLLKDLALYADTLITEGNTLIIFDEIQECQQALNSLKYFREQAPDYHVVAAGSLLGIKLGSNRSFPVGQVDFLDLRPLSFFEFLDASGKDTLRLFLEALDDVAPIAEPIHEQLLRLVKEYLFTGGMPSVLNQYFANKETSYAAARKEQLGILEGYSFDFSKYSTKLDALKVLKLWQSIPNQLSKENKKFAYSVLQSGARAKDYEYALQWLVDCGLVYKLMNVKSPQLPLMAASKENIFKLYLLDVGLLGAMYNLTAKTIIDGHELFTCFKGSLTENFVLQQLMLQHQGQVAYWTSQFEAEVDFIVAHENQIYPLEIKSGTNKKKKSLTSYITQFKPAIAFRGSTLNLKKDGVIFNLPLYLIQRFPWTR